MATSTDGINFTTQISGLLDLAEVLPDWNDFSTPYLRDFAVVDIDGEDWFYFTYCGVAFGGDLCETGTSYITVARPGYPVLTLTKSVDDDWPDTGQQIVYTLNVSNTGLISATNVIISDTLDSNLSFVGPVTLDPPQPDAILATSALSLPTVASNVTLNAGQEITLTLPVQVNSGLQDGLIISNTASVTGTRVLTLTSDRATVTTVAPSFKVYLPLILKPEPLTYLYVESANTGGINLVEIRNPNDGDALLLSCGPIGNDVTTYCGSFPPVGTYKIIAHTTNCGVQQKTFHDADAYDAITRKVYCN
jgi:uncharacterized repeat protein (TIGR01451 family)